MASWSTEKCTINESVITIEQTEGSVKSFESFDEFFLSWGKVIHSPLLITQSNKPLEIIHSALYKFTPNSQRGKDFLNKEFSKTSEIVYKNFKVPQQPPLPSNYLELLMNNIPERYTPSSFDSAAYLRVINYYIKYPSQEMFDLAFICCPVEFFLFMKEIQSYKPTGKKFVRKIFPLSLGYNEKMIAEYLQKGIENKHSWSPKLKNYFSDHQGISSIFSECLNKEDLVLKDTFVAKLNMYTSDLLKN